MNEMTIGQLFTNELFWTGFSVGILVFALVENMFGKGGAK